jgi:signal transduction histidine kinase/ActR/RegA family two-component response regulator
MNSNGSETGPARLGRARPEQTLDIFLGFAKDVIAIDNVEDLAWYVAEEIVARLGFLDCVIYRYEAADEVLRQIAAIGDKTPERGVILNPLVIPLGQGITGSVAQTRAVEHIDAAASDPRYVPDLMAPGSELCVPIIHDGVLLGVIDSEHPDLGWFTRSDEELLTSIAAIMASQWAQCELMTSLRETTERLRRAEAQAAAANAAKSVFIANMSHELRTPLHGVIGTAQLLKAGALDANQSQFVDIIQTSGQTLLGLIEDVLDLSKFEAGTVEWTAEPFDLPEAVESVVGAVAVLARAKGLDFSVKIDPSVPRFVRGDKRRLAQILNNLLGNAVKFTETGGVSLRVRRRFSDGVRFEAEDTGPGLSPADQQAVFDRFARTPAAEEAGTTGAGLGLAIVKEITERAGGGVGVESEAGHGACFWAELPLPAVRHEASPETRLRAVSGDETVVRAANCPRVLVVDDVDTNRLVALSFVKDAGYDVETACNGQEAVEKVRSGTFDAVLMDIRMPVMSGDEAIRQIRGAEADWSDIPILALTADATPETRDRVMSMGATGYLAKPLNLYSVVDALKGAIRG